MKKVRFYIHATQCNVAFQSNRSDLSKKHLNSSADLQLIQSASANMKQLHHHIYKKLPFIILKRVFFTSISVPMHVAQALNS